MEIITAILEGFDLGKIIPDLSKFLGRLQTVAGIAVMVGPVVMLALGIWYWLYPPQEANHKIGFRTYFGMGSVEAWQFTQLLAGKVCTTVLFVSLIAMVLFPELDPNTVAAIAITDGCFLAFSFMNYILAYYGKDPKVQDIGQ